MRSLLFIPADDERKLAKGLATGADALILDLEDAVAPPRKAAARILAARYIAETRPHPEIGPPLPGNGLGSGCRHAREDL